MVLYDIHDRFPMLSKVQEKCSIDCWTETSRFIPAASYGASSASFGEKV